MKNVICRTSTLYTKYVADFDDFADVKHILADFYRDGFNIDSDPELQRQFEVQTYPAWIKANQAGIASLHSRDRALTGECVRTMHLNDTDECIGIGIVTVQDLVAYHRFRAVHPDFRGQGYAREQLWNGLAFCFDYAEYDGLVTEYPKDIQLPPFMGEVMLEEKQSSGRGVVEHYKVAMLKKEQYQASKRDAESAYHQYVVTFEEVT
jgi:GNAT superfamily N-acetyltransferase